MTGVVVNRNNNLVIKDGEDNLPIHPNWSYMAKIGKIYEFVYTYVNENRYAELIKEVK